MSKRIPSHCPVCSTKLDDETGSTSESIRCEGCGGLVILKADVAAVNPTSKRTVPRIGTLGRFELKEILGEGAFGRVYRAFDPLLERDVALKVPTFSSSDQQRVARFSREAKTAAKLRHPNIVPTFETGKADGKFFIVSQYIVGQTLTQRVRHDSPSFQQIASWIATLAAAMAYAHRQGIVHRDIKPDNIMIDEQSLPQIMDFGLAKQGDLAGLTHDGKIVGTPAYMSPEQARGEVNILPVSDQYSLGTVLYELLTGQRPYTGDYRAVVSHVANAMVDPPAPRDINSLIPKDLETICRKAMAKNPSDRYESCDALADDLIRWQQQLPIAARTLAFPERIARFSKRNPALSVLIVGLFVVAGVLGVTLSLVWRQYREKESLLAAIDQTSKSLESKTSQVNALQVQKQQIEAAIAERDDDLKRKIAEVTEKEHRLVTLDSENKRMADQYQQLQEKMESAERDLANVERDLKLQQTLAKNSEDEKLASEYVAKIRLASSLIEKGDFVNARRALNDCDERLINWEWRYLSRALATDVMRWSASVSDLCFDPSGIKLALDFEQSGIEVLDLPSRMTTKLPASQPDLEKFRPIPISSMSFSDSGEYLIAVPWQITNEVRRADYDNSVSISWVWDITRESSGWMPGLQAVFIPGTRIRIHYLAEFQDQQTVKISYGVVNSQNQLLGQKDAYLSVRVKELSRFPYRFFATDSEIIELRRSGTTAELRPLIAAKQPVDASAETVDWKTDSRQWFRWNVDKSFDSSLCELSRNGKTFAYAANDLVHVIDRLERKELSKRSFPGVTSLSLNHAGDRLAISSEDGVYVHDLTSLKEPTRIDDPGIVEFHPTDHQVVVASGKSVTRHFLPIPPIDTNQGGVNAISFNKSGSLVASAGANGSVAVWDVATREKRFMSPPQRSAAMCVCFVDDDRQVALGSLDNELRIWSIETGQPMNSTTIHPAGQRKHLGGIRSIAFNESDQMLAAIDAFSTVSVANLDGEKVYSKKLEATLTAKKEQESVRGAAWIAMEDSNLQGLITSSRFFGEGDLGIEIWHPQSDALLRRLEGPGSLTFSYCKQSNRLAVGYESGKVVVWDLGDERPVPEHVFPNVHVGDVRSVSFSPDGTRVATLGNEYIKILDANRGRELLTIQLPGGRVSQVEFSPDGRTLAACSSESGKLWILDGGAREIAH